MKNWIDIAFLFKLSCPSPRLQTYSSALPEAPGARSLSACCCRDPKSLNILVSSARHARLFWLTATLLPTHHGTFEDPIALDSIFFQLRHSDFACFTWNFYMILINKNIIVIHILVEKTHLDHLYLRSTRLCRAPEPIFSPFIHNLDSVGGASELFRPPGIRRVLISATGISLVFFLPACSHCNPNLVCHESRPRTLRLDAARFMPVPHA